MTVDRRPSSTYPTEGTFVGSEKRRPAGGQAESVWIVERRAVRCACGSRARPCTKQCIVNQGHSYQGRMHGENILPNGCCFADIMTKMH